MEHDDQNPITAATVHDELVQALVRLIDSFADKAFVLLCDHRSGVPEIDVRDETVDIVAEAAWDAMMGLDAGLQIMLRKSARQADFPETLKSHRFVAYFLENRPDLARKPAKGGRKNTV